MSFSDNSVINDAVSFRFCGGVKAIIKNTWFYSGSWKILTNKIIASTILLSVVNTHIISFRPAKRSDREAYHDWLENDYDDD